MEYYVSERMEKLHNLEMKIALEIKRICDENGIPYFLTAGTLLGAVRHGGFIPWDDDMDIGMLRSDYERFLKICENNLGADYFLQTWDTDPQFPFSYGKIRLVGTRVVEQFSQGTHLKCDGIFVDVFPFDSVPDQVILRKLQSAKYYICKRILWVKKGMGTDMKRGGMKKRIKYYLLKTFSCFFRYDVVKAYYKKIQIKYNRQVTKKVVADGAYSYKKESIEREWVANLEPIQFENATFLSYKDKTDYLKYFYGDYMKLPPEDKRGGHSMVHIDFGGY